MKKFIIILCIFFLDRVTKVYLLKFQAEGTDIDFYITSFLNFYLVWNTGIGFGLAAMESNIYYHILTSIILIINIGLIFFLIKSSGLYAYLHIGNYHWFIFNVADIFISVGIIGLILFELLKKDKISKNV